MPIRPKRADKSKAHTDDERQAAAESVQSVIECVLRDLPRLWRDGIEIICPDGKTRIGHPAVGAWLADYPEYIKLFTASFMSCPICIVPRNQLDAHPTTWVDYKALQADEIREQVLAKEALEAKVAALKKNTPEYKRLSKEIESIDDFFAYHRIAAIDNLLFRFPFASPVSLWKPDLLHTMDLGLTKTTLELLFNLLDELSTKAKKDYRPLTEIFDIIWTGISPHPAISVPRKKYRSVKQWSGKEYRNAQSILQAVLEAVFKTYPAPVSKPNDEERYNGALGFISALSNFYLMARQKSHTLPPDTVFDNNYRALWDGEREPDVNSSISYMQNYLAEFHKWKHIFLKYRASKTVKREAKEAALGKYPDLTSEELKALPPKEQVRRKAKIAADRKAYKLELVERNSHYNLPKFHMLGHFAEIIHQFGSLPQYSTSINELLHQPLNNAYDRTNKVDAMDQTLRFAGWKDALAIKVMNLIHHCKKEDIPAEAITEIKTWLDIFDNRKARLEAARLNRNRMGPRREAAERKREKAAAEREHWELLRGMFAEYGLSDGEDEDSDNSDDDDHDVTEEIRLLTMVPPSQTERSAKDRQRDPGRLLRGRMLSIKNDEGDSRRFTEVRDIEEFLRIKGLSTALGTCLRDERFWVGAISYQEVSKLEASPYCALRIRRYTFQSDTELENHIIRCTAGENFRNSLPRADFVVYTPARRHEIPDQPIMGKRTIGHLRCLFRVRFEGREGSKASYGRFAAVHPMIQERMTPEEVTRGMPSFKYDQEISLEVIRIGTIERAACVVPIWNRKFLPPSGAYQLWEHAERVVFNTKVDLETFHSCY